MKLICNDCLEELSKMDEESVDLVITSPPYDDLREYNSYVNFEEIIKQLYRVLKRGGVVVWNINDKIKNGSKTLSSFRQAIIFQTTGFNVNDVMIWEKTNPMPQVKQPRYNQVFEYMFIFSKGKPKTFNPILVDCKSADKYYRSTCKKITKGKERTYKEFIINKKKVDSNVWRFAVAQNKTEHPAVFPLELPMKHIQSWSNEGDLVLDPFMGSGTTGLACKLLNRDFIGIELDPNYCKIAEERINGERKDNAGDNTVL
ncbi:MAG: site-specific DNA-methyltransferase [Bacilli bacterium]|nr:site-specific DNA-methyltransferase [Bacilli bacterium]